MVSVNTKSGPMDQIGKITSILSINNGIIASRRKTYYLLNR